LNAQSCGVLQYLQRNLAALMHANVRKLKILHMLIGIVFWYPIEKLYIQELGASPFGVSVNAAVFLATIMIFDVPSGVLADKWKHKYTLLLAIMLFIASCVWGGLSTTFWQYLPMNILLGGFIVLTSGTFQAMMYDSLKDTGSEAGYDRHQGQAYALFLAGLGVSSLAGGYLADWFGLPATYFITAAVMCLAVGVCLSLREPASHKRIADRKLKEHIKYSMRQVLATRLLFQLALLVTAMGIIRGSHTEYSGLLFVVLGMSTIQMGYANATKWLVSSLGQIVAPKIGRKAIRLVPVFFFASLAFSLIHSAWSLVFFYIAYAFYNIIANQAEAAVQDNTPSEIRATTLSILSFMTNALLVPLGLLFGWLASVSNIFNAYLAIAAIGSLYLISWVWGGRRTLASIWQSGQPTARR
jgi:hypothetical protein